MRITRRGALTVLGAGASLALGKTQIDAGLVRRHDEYIDRGLAAQVTDPASRGYGCVPNAHGIFNPEPAAGWIEACTAAYLYQGSRFHKSALLFERIKLAADFLTRTQHPDGLVDYLDTNFDSAPDAAFTAWSVATAACLTSRSGERELLALIEPFLRKAAAGMVIGGIHTPNHRWVVSSALAQINEVFPDPSYVRRIDQWLAEGIDLDADGQFTERSTTVYNPICDRSFLVMAVKLKRPELLTPVRTNLESMLYLLHSDFEVVTEISRRQDQNVRGNMSGYWSPLRYLAIHDSNGRFAAIAGRYTDTAASLSMLMEYPEMLEALPPSIPPPDNYTREMNALGIVRFRRGLESSTLLAGQPKFFATRNGGAVIEGVRFALKPVIISRSTPHYVSHPPIGVSFGTGASGRKTAPLTKLRNCSRSQRATACAFGQMAQTAYPSPLKSICGRAANWKAATKFFRAAMPDIRSPAPPFVSAPASGNTAGPNSAARCRNCPDEAFT